MPSFDVEGARKAGYSDAEISAHLARQQGYDVEGARKAGHSEADILAHLAPSPSSEQPGKLVSAAAGLGTGVGRTVLGAQKLLGQGVRAVGATGAGDWLVRDADEGRAKLAGELEPYRKANPLSAGAGQIAGEIAATLPVGGALAKGITSVAPRLAQAAPGLVQAIQTSGMTTGAAGAARAATAGGRAADLGVRALGGAVTGGASAALVDQDEAGTGALVGAAMPAALKAGGKVLKAGGSAVGITGQELKALFQSDATRGAQELMKALEVTPDQLPAVLAQLRGARSAVPGVTPTVAEVLTSPQAAILQRVVSAGPGGEKLRLALATQAEARIKALQGVVPGAANKTSVEAAENFGRTAAQERGELRGWVKTARDAQYKSPALEGATLNLPDKAQLRSMVEKFYPGQAFDNAPGDLRSLVGRLQTDAPVSIQEFDALRKLAGNRAADLADSDRTAATAWRSVKGLMDDAEAAAVGKSERLAPTGQGPFGPVYGGLAGDPENAVAHLLRTGQGSVPGAATNKMAGAVDFVAGNPVQAGPGAFGLLHIDAKGRDEALRRLPALAENGVPYSRLQETKSGALQPKGGRKGWFYVGDGDYEALLRGDYNFSPTDRPWNHTAYKIEANKKLPAGTGQSSSATSLTAPTQTSAPTAGPLSMPDIEASFKAFDNSLRPPVPVRDPRAYSGELAGALDPEAAQALAQGRTLHRDMVQRFDTGPWAAAMRTGSDGLPQAQGAELGRRLVNGGSSQLADAQALKAATLERGPSQQAAREYLLADLLEKVAPEGRGLSAPGLQRYLDGRSLTLKELMQPEQLQALQAVAGDANRSAEAARRAMGPGSNTYQNAANALDAGLLDSPLVKQAAQRMPVLRALAEPARAAMAETASKGKALRLADLLADPAAAAAALQGQQRGAAGNAWSRFSSSAGGALNQELPGMPGLSLRDLLLLGTYRAAPVAAATN